MALWKARGGSLNKDFEFRSWHCGRQGGGKWVLGGASEYWSASDLFEAQVIRRRNLLKPLHTFRTLLKPPSNLSEAPLKPSEALLKPTKLPWSPLHLEAPFKALLKPLKPSWILFKPPWSRFTLKPHWSLSQAPWSPLEAPLKPPWSRSQAPLKPAFIQAPFKPFSGPWSPLKPFSSRWTPLEAPLKPFSSPLEAPFKPLKWTLRVTATHVPGASLVRVLPKQNTFEGFEAAIRYVRRRHDPKSNSLAFHNAMI